MQRRSGSIPLEAIVHALEWIVGAQPNKRDPCREKATDMSVIRDLQVVAEADSSDLSVDRLLHLGNTYASSVIGALEGTHSERSVFLTLLNSRLPLAEKDAVIKEKFFISDPKTVRAKRAELINGIGNLLLDDDEARRRGADPEGHQETIKDTAGNPGSLKWVRLIALVLVLAGIGMWLLRLLPTHESENGRISFSIAPPTCPVDVCNSEHSAMKGISREFTPGGIVGIEILTPSGADANELAGPYSYGTTPSVGLDGTFKWVYWWDPGMELGTYTTTVTDVETGRSLTRQFTFTRAAGDSPGKIAATSDP
jgi:hypothetical protein